MDSITDLMAPFTKAENYHPKKMMENAKDCSGMMEFSVCTMLSLLASTCGAGFPGAVLFSVVYALYGSQFKHRARGNPCLTFADWLSGDISGPWDATQQMIFQCLGWTMGNWLSGVIFHPEEQAAVNFATDAATIIVQEMVAAGFFVWLWLSIHHKDTAQPWDDFKGLAVGIALWVSFAVKSDNAIHNPARFFGQGERFQVFNPQNDFNGATWLINFFAPFFAAFVATLVFRWSRQ